MAKREIPHDHIVHPQRGDGFGQSCVAGVDVRLTQPGGRLAGRTVTGAAGIIRPQIFPYLLADGRTFLGVGAKLPELIVIDHDANLRQGIEVPQKSAQFLNIKHRDHGIPHNLHKILL